MEEIEMAEKMNSEQMRGKAQLENQKDSRKSQNDRQESNFKYHLEFSRMKSIWNT